MKKIKKILLSIFLPVVMILTAGILSFASITETAHALSGNGGGLFVGSNTTLNFNATISGSSATNGGGVYVSNGGTFNMNGGSISGNTATDGGGVYVANGGTFNMFGGSISGNKATNNGDSIYNNGTFIMTGGTLGETNGVAWVYCDRNAVTQIYGGTVHDNFYMYSNLQTKMGTTINGKIFLAETSTITVQDYAGTTPEYNIEVSSSRQSGTIVTFKGSTVEPILSKINVTGYDSESYAVKTKKDSSGNWTISLVENSYDFPSDWKTQVASSTHMTTTVTPANLTSIKFVATVPTGYTQVGTLSTGLPVYKGTTATDIAFVGKKIFAPADSSQLFYNLSKLTTLDMSVFNTSNVTNMNNMFGYCSALTSLDVSGFNTSNVTNMYSMFYNCKTLTSLDPSKFSTSNVTNMSYMFSRCNNLTSLDLSNFNTTKVTSMNSMLSDCSSLTSLDVSGFNTSNVTDMSNMFYGCSVLTSLNVINFNTTKVTNMASMFSYCNNLTSLDVSGFNTSNVTNMNNMFGYCSALTSLDLSSFNMAKVTDSGNMLNFGTSNKIQTLKTPYNNTSAIAITTGSTLYNEDTGAVVTTVPAGTTKSLTYTNENPIKTFPTTWKTEVASSSYMTTTVTPANLKSIKFVSSVPSGYTKIGTLSTGLSVYKGTTATEIAFVGRKIMAPANSSWLFSSMSNLKAVDFSHFKTGNATNMSYMFSGCSTLTSLDLSGFNTAKVTDMSSMFKSCSKLTSLDLSGFNTANVTTMSWMFEGCSKLTSLDLSGFNTANVADMSLMFHSCNKLTSLNVGGFNTANVTSMSSMFEYCFELTSLDLSGFNTANVTDMSSMFKHCSSLESLNISSFNMTKVTSSSYMLYFSSTNKIKTFKTPYNNSVEIPITTGIKLYRMSNSVEISSVPANTASSFDIVGCESHNYTISDTSYEPIDSMNHSMTITRTCSNCGCKSITTKTMKHSFISGVCKMCGYGGFIEYIINKNQDGRNIDIIFEKDKQRKEFFVLKVAG